MRPQDFRQVVITVSTCAGIGLLIVILVLTIKARHQQSCPPCVCPLQQQQQQQPQQQQPQQQQQQQQLRDRRVISDPLYPPLNRTDEQEFLAIQDQIAKGNLYQRANHQFDSFHLVGILSSTDQEHKDAGYNQWKLFGRMKDRNQGDYYIIPANNNIDLKIPLTSDIIQGERLRDIYTLPTEMRFRSPMLNDAPYIFTELPKSDLTSGTRYI